jgi:hypothetical protein
MKWRITKRRWDWPEREEAKERWKDFCLRGSAQPFEKAQNGQENPRKTKPFSPISFARLGWIWLGFAQFGIGLESGRITRFINMEA